MTSDKYGNIVYTSSDIVDLLYKGKFQYLDQIFCENNKEIQALAEISNIQLKHIDESFYDISISDFDSACQNDWLMPQEYKTMDIEAFIIDRSPKENLTRIVEELQEYIKLLLEFLSDPEHYEEEERQETIERVVHLKAVLKMYAGSRDEYEEFIKELKE